MGMIQRDTEFADTQPTDIVLDGRSQRERDARALNRYFGERPIHDTGRVQIGIAHTQRQSNRAPIDPEWDPYADRARLVRGLAFAIGMTALAFFVGASLIGLMTSWGWLS